MIECRSEAPAAAERIAAVRITTPAGSTIERSAEGGYRICDADHHCRQAASLWEAQQLVQWAEVHHRPLSDRGGMPGRGSAV